MNELEETYGMASPSMGLSRSEAIRLFLLLETHGGQRWGRSFTPQQNVLPTHKQKKRELPLPETPLLFFMLFHLVLHTTD